MIVRDPRVKLLAAKFVGLRSRCFWLSPGFTVYGLGFGFTVYGLWFMVSVLGFGERGGSRMRVRLGSGS